MVSSKNAFLLKATKPPDVMSQACFMLPFPFLVLNGMEDAGIKTWHFPSHFQSGNANVGPIVYSFRNFLLAHPS